MTSESYIHPINPETLRVRPSERGARLSGKVVSTNREASKVFTYLSTLDNIEMALDHAAIMSSKHGEVVTGPAIDTRSSFRNRRVIYDHDHVGIWAEVTNHPDEIKKWLERETKNGSI